jgi:hypothetical protein
MTALLHGWLFAWLFALGISLGSLANLMVLALTGGRWAQPAAPAWRAAASLLPLEAALFLPLALGVHAAWPWTDAPGKWLNVPFFIARSAGYLLAWSLLAWGFLRSSDTRRRSAAGLIVYAVTVSLAATDWIASLMPQWYSSGFGLLVGTGQMLSGAAFGVAAAAWASPPSRDAATLQRFHDLGNLLLMYVMTWAYLGYTQFVIIWSENLPREIAWYVPRLQTGWAALAIVIVALHFAVPFAVLLSRQAKRSPRFLGGVAVALLAVHAVQVYWLVMPSVRPQGFRVAWSDPVAFALLGAAWAWAWRRGMRKASGQAAEPAHG